MLVQIESSNLLFNNVVKTQCYTTLTVSGLIFTSLEQRTGDGVTRVFLVGLVNLSLK